ncbi:hypothetical protein [Pseudoalteromonas umbrosa]|uniref:hypothetical protein n=1 Tax=Pseudoalteromonas umbrosa TaxID=3048489 RepID=UPI0024C46DB6|nr:hypothetical protein [Pseudoalteromonas sp. B95]MDK1286637.1 hypothetical protein [Pseudoalteromonas sp. B95]
MKMFKVGTLAAAMLTAVSAVAAPINVADTNGYDRHTVYSYGPVSRVVITSEFAHNFSADVELRDGARCDNGNLYSNVDSSHVVNVGIQADATNANAATIGVTNAIAEDKLTHNKTLHLSCYDADNTWYNVLVNVPSAPIVDWDITVEPAGDFVNQPYSFGYHSAFRVKSTLNVNNQNKSQSYCYTVANRGLSLGLFHGSDTSNTFHSDVFTQDKVYTNDTAQPVLYQIVQCENAAGKTMAVKVFNLTDPNGIYTYEDQLIIK